MGLLLPSRDAVALGESPRELVELACEAEALGYDSVWLGESIVARPRFDPLITLAAIASRTDRIGLGTAVLVATLRHPVHLAHSVACLDQLSDGRVILGVGAGPSYGPARKEYATLGIPFEKRFERLCEAVHLCRLLWQAESATFDGTYYHVRDVTIGPKPVQDNGPAVWLGVKGPLGRHLAGEQFDGWLPGPQSPEWFAAGLEEVRNRAASTLRSVTGAVYVTVTICTDTEAGRRSARTAIERYYQQPYESVANLHDSYLGSAAGAAAWLNCYVRSGADHVVVRLLGVRLDEQMRQLAEHLPAIRRRAVACNPKPS
ncbi:LLM class flavin-dependent oxidoreductase [Nocardia neocaledoniensis]|uniref:LLM class flavin-dependent oxidoreductase n=1 Tax=Nocardia neocaledoniensis TaxID=236511 RepID=UPI0024589104|nr:LLM class flavin-dependent oxidoreductase [Nocardia neocaledoniensis]